MSWEQSNRGFQKNWNGRGRLGAPILYYIKTTFSPASSSQDSICASWLCKMKWKMTALLLPAVCVALLQPICAMELFPATHAEDSQGRSGEPYLNLNWSLIGNVLRCKLCNGRCQSSPYNQTNYKLCPYTRSLEVGMKPDNVDRLVAKRKGEEANPGCTEDAWIALNIK